MHILLSNDDGYLARGLRVMAEALAEFASVTIVAPEFIIESRLDRIAPINPAATRPTTPYPTGATISFSSTVNAASWATGKKIGLLDSKAVKKKTAWTAPAVEATTPKGGKSTTGVDQPKPETLTESPDSVPGAFLRASVYDDHWVTYGYGRDIDVLMSGSLILEPLKPTVGRN